jgi:hypothetical protein
MVAGNRTIAMNKQLDMVGSWIGLESGWL